MVLFIEYTLNNTGYFPQMCIFVCQCSWKVWKAAQQTDNIVNLCACLGDWEVSEESLISFVFFRFLHKDIDILQ